MKTFASIVEAQSILHLFLWNRFEPDEHRRALQIISELSNQYSDKLVILVRPVGRNIKTYQSFADRDFAQHHIGSLTKFPHPSPDCTCHSEAWIQVSPTADRKMHQELIDQFQTLPSFCAFGNHRNSLWAPFGEDLYSCIYAASRKNSQNAFVCSLCDERVSWLLKLIWFRSTGVIVDWLVKNNYQTAIDPVASKSTVRQLMSEMFQDIDLAEYGILTDSKVIDPTEFHASHMAAFALNAIVELNPPNWGLEDYFNNDDATRPTNCDSRSSFLKIFE